MEKPEREVRKASHWQQATMEIMRRNHSTRTLVMLNRSQVSTGRVSTPQSFDHCFFAPHIWVLFFAHIPFVVTQRQWRGSNNIPSFYNEPHRSHVLFVKSAPGTTFTSWSQHHILLRSESPSGKCAKLHTVSANSSRDHMPWSLYHWLFAPRIYGCYSSRTSRSWWIAHSTPHQRRGCNNIPSFLQRTAPIACSFCEGCTWLDLHTLVTAPLCWRVSLYKHINSVNLIHSDLGEGEDVTQSRGCLRHEAGSGFERWHCTICCPRLLRRI